MQRDMLHFGAAPPSLGTTDNQVNARPVRKQIAGCQKVSSSSMKRLPNTCDAIKHRAVRAAQRSHPRDKVSPTMARSTGSGSGGLWDRGSRCSQRVTSQNTELVSSPSCNLDLCCISSSNAWANAFEMSESCSAKTCLHVECLFVREILGTWVCILASNRKWCVASGKHSRRLPRRALQSKTPSRGRPAAVGSSEGGPQS